MLAFFDASWLNLIYKPIYNLVIATYNLTPGPNFGLAVIGLAILIRFIFLYFTLLGYKHDQQLAEIKPAISQIEDDDSYSSREKIDRVSKLLKPHGINPFLVSLPLFAQIIFLGVLYQIIQVGISPTGFGNLYNFVKVPEDINVYLLGFNMIKPNLVLATAAAFVLFIERVWEYSEKKEIKEEVLSQKWDPLIWPFMSFIILLILPSAKSIFMITSVGFSLVVKAAFHVGRKTA